MSNLFRTRSERNKMFVVATVAALLSTVMAVPASASGSRPQDAAAKVDEVTARVPGLNEMLDATDATPVDGVKTNVDATTAAAYDSGSGSIDVPVDPSVGILLTASTGSVITIGVPGNPDDAVVAADGSVSYKNSRPGASIIVQPQIDGGARMITVLESADAQTSYGYAITLAGGQTISLTDDGGAAIISSTGEVDVAIPAPWAYDASGTVIATDYTLEGTTLTLNIHPTSSAVYPVIADPVFTWGWVTGTVYFNKAETRIICTNGVQSLVWLGVTGFWYPVLAALGWYLSFYSCTAGALGQCIKVKSYGAIYIYTGNHCY